MGKGIICGADIAIQLVDLRVFTNDISVAAVTDTHRDALLVQYYQSLLNRIQAGPKMRLETYPDRCDDILTKVLILTLNSQLD